MGFLAKTLAATASAAAMLTGMMANDVERLRRSRDTFAPTKRKPEVKRKRRLASDKRDRQRKTAHAAYERQLRMEREIGIDPIFLNGSRAEKDAARPAWLRQRHEWLRANRGRT